MNDDYLRNKPRYSGSQRTVHQIIDAAERLFLEIGYDKVTTRKIAEAAGVPVGSLYHFFPNKVAILDGAAQRHFADQEELHRSVNTFSPHQDLYELVEHLVDRVAEHAVSRKPFEQIIAMPSSSPEILRYREVFGANILGRTIDNIRGAFPRLGEEDLKLVANISSTALRSLVPIMNEARDSRSKRAVRAAIIRMITALWLPYIDINDTPLNETKASH